MAILLSGPITLYPAIRIMEHSIFVMHSGKENFRVKWMKNMFRALLVSVCVTVSWVGAADLDKFAAFVGCFTALVYLVFVHLAVNVDIIG
jgi:solute carrier family 36 (proton-coupled amino acid transporter)